MANNRAVVGVFHTEEEAIRAINQLHKMGYHKEQISVLAENPDRFKQLDRDSDVDVDTPKDVGKGAAAGAITGGVLGGLGALVVELGILAIPGVGPFLAAGPIAATIGGLVAGGALGGVVGALVGLGIEKDEAKIYEQNLKDGDILIVVDTDEDRYENVRSTLGSRGYSTRDDHMAEHDLERNRLGYDGLPNDDHDNTGLEHRSTVSEHVTNEQLNENLDQDRLRSDPDHNLGETFDRNDRIDRDPLGPDKDGRLDRDDLRRSPLVNDDKI